jgi:YidC/Oxa1 family membrane protein insertase
MSIISGFFNIFLYQPLMNILVFLYQIIPGQDFGIAIILLTILIRFLLYPVSAKGVKSQKIINEIQPEIKEVQEKYKNQKEIQVKKILEIYKKAKISPFSAIAPLLIQLPVLIALYRVLWGVQTTDALKSLYSFIPTPTEIVPMFLGRINLSGIGFIQEINGETSFLIGNTIIVLGAVLAQFIQMKMVLVKKPKTSINKKDNSTQEITEKMQRQMIYFFPFFTLFILMKLPLAIALYWLVSTSFSIVQQYLIFKDYKKLEA